MRKPMLYVVLVLTLVVVAFLVDFNAKAAALLVGLASMGVVTLFLMVSQVLAGMENYEKLLSELTVANDERVKDLAAVAQIVSWLMKESSEELPGVPSDVLDRLHDLLPKEEKGATESLAAEIVKIEALYASGTLNKNQAEAAKNRLIGISSPTRAKPPIPPQPAAKTAGQTITGNASAAGTTP